MAKLRIEETSMCKLMPSRIRSSPRRSGRYSRFHSKPAKRPISRIRDKSSMRHFCIALGREKLRQHCGDGILPCIKFYAYFAANLSARSGVNNHVASSAMACPIISWRRRNRIHAGVAWRGGSAAVAACIKSSNSAKTDAICGWHNGVVEQKIVNLLLAALVSALSIIRPPGAPLLLNNAA